MENERWITEQINRKLGSKHAGYFLINGAPKSGKSTFLKKLADCRFQTFPATCQVFGPFSLNACDQAELPKILMKAAVDAAFIENPNIGFEQYSLEDFWRHLASNLTRKRQFVVLLDMSDSDEDGIPSLASLFSSTRFLEGSWSDLNCRFVFVITGFWQESKLRAYYDSIGVSFPYVIGHNYAEWTGISVEDIANLVKDLGHADVSILHCSVLKEISGGHPGVIQEILQRHESGPIRLASILWATRDAALDSNIANIFVKSMQSLSSPSRNVITRLLMNRYIVSDVVEEDLSALRMLGIVARERTNSSLFLSFRSWFAEVLCRLNATSIGLNDFDYELSCINELVPQVSSINAEAYPLIHEVENLVRSFVVIEMSKAQPKSQTLLQGRGKVDRDNRTIQERAERWKNSSGLMLAKQNPIIAFCSTRDLADMVKEIGYQIRLSAWDEIADSLRSLAYIRDAVMHNQLIEFEELERLHTLRSKIIAAISKTSG